MKRMLLLIYFLNMLCSNVFSQKLTDDDITFLIEYHIKFETTINNISQDSLGELVGYYSIRVKIEKDSNNHTKVISCEPNISMPAVLFEKMKTSVSNVFENPKLDTLFNFSNGYYLMPIYIDNRKDKNNETKSSSPWTKSVFTFKEDGQFISNHAYYMLPPINLEPNYHQSWPYQ